MRIFKTKVFHQWTAREGLADTELCLAVQEIEQGLVEANLGGNVYKKRVALPGRGKRSSARTLIAFKQEDKAFFIYGFAKNQRDNINKSESRALKLLAAQLLGLSKKELVLAIIENELIEVSYNE